MKLNQPQILVMIVALVLLVALLVVGILYVTQRPDPSDAPTDGPGTVPDPDPSASSAEPTAVPDGVTVDPITGEAVVIVPDAEVESGVTSAEAQVEALLLGLKNRDAEAIVKTYHPNYWTKEGVTVEEAVENTEGLLEELALEDVTYSVKSLNDASEESAQQHRKVAEGYEIAADRIGGVRQAMIEFSYRYETETYSMLLVFDLIEIDGNWFVATDLGQMFY